MAEARLRSLLVDGVISGVGGVLAFLPQILILYFFIGLLEDCGYMARAAFLMDRLMLRIGLSGKSFIPMLSSFACTVPGIMAARVIEDERDRLTTILVSPLVDLFGAFAHICLADRRLYSLAILPERIGEFARAYLGRTVRSGNRHGRNRGDDPETDFAPRPVAVVRNGIAQLQVAVA